MWLQFILIYDWGGLLFIVLVKGMIAADLLHDCFFDNRSRRPTRSETSTGFRMKDVLISYYKFPTCSEMPINKGFLKSSNRMPINKSSAYQVLNKFH